MTMVPETPVRIPVRLVCPDCNQALQVDMLVTTKLTVEGDEEGDVSRILEPKVKRQSIAHACHQQTLDDGLHQTVKAFQSDMRDLVTNGDVERVTLTHDGRTVDVVTGEVIE